MGTYFHESQNSCSNLGCTSLPENLLKSRLFGVVDVTSPESCVDAVHALLSIDRREKKRSLRLWFPHTSNYPELFAIVLFHTLIYLQVVAPSSFSPWMADPNLDHGFVFDDQGLVDVLHSPFFDIDFENDHTVEEYVDRILFSLATAIDQRRPPVQWQLSHPPPVTSFSGAHKKLIFSPPVAVFPHPLQSDLTFPRYWNYLRKQTFVLESYIDNVNWMMNRALFSSHIYLSWSFVVPYFMAMIHIGAALRAPYSKYPVTENTSSYGLSLSGCLAVCTIVELLAMWNLTKVEVQLCNMLSPEGPRVSLRSYNWGLVFVAMLVDNFLYPISSMRSHFSQTINWSGIRYHLKRGKVNKHLGVVLASGAASGYVKPSHTPIKAVTVGVK
ncbi:hypothetical protein M5K25_010870 [Dendrobium thyrsiflorum]|uniref:Ceramide glucosyltransferase n=1 Tax=Dendrobium thyrsiflorum TaxID=117978 RepID=A0ABD0V0S2_DENTH